jgi:hypothetical protein
LIPSLGQVLIKQERTIAFVFELLLQLVLEVVGQVVFEIAAGLGWESLKEPLRREREARDTSPFLRTIGCFLWGLVGGVLSILLVNSRLAPQLTFPGISLVLSPICTGVAMHGIGEWWGDRRRRPALFSFSTGAIFALGMALVRFIHFELGWIPF